MLKYSSKLYSQSMVEIKAYSHSFNPPNKKFEGRLCVVGFLWDGEEIEIYGQEAWDLIQKADILEQENSPEVWERLSEVIKNYLEL